MAARSELIKPVIPGKPVCHCEDPDIENASAAHMVLSAWRKKGAKFNEAEVIEIFHAMPTVMAAAVAIRVAQDLDPGEIPDFLDLLEDFS
jgi:hypothetical protein